jgi:autotransporter-associated beta strand protein
MKRIHVTIALSGAALAAGANLTWAGITADQVLGTYLPGNLAASADTAWENASAALGPLSGDTLQGFGGLTPFNPAFDTGQIVGIGPGGELTLHLSSAVAVAAAPTLGVFSNNGLVDVSADGSGLASTPASTFDDPDHPSAIVSVSADGVHFVAINGGNPIVFSNPSNYYTDRAISSGIEPLGLAVANQFQPFAGNLSSFDGKSFSQIKTILNGSAGGNWVSLAGTGLSSVVAVRFDVPSGADVPMFVDSVAGVAGQSTDIWNNSGGSGDGLTWNTAQPNWNNGAAAITYNDYTYPTTAGDNVVFNDSNHGNYNVSIPGVVHPASVTINNSSQPYWFNGSGGIAGGGGLTKLGTGSLVLATSNSYTGTTNVSGGALVLGSAGALPAGTALMIGSNAVVTAQNFSGGLVVASLSLSGSTNHWTGKLDLGNNSVLVQNADLGTLTNQLAQGYAGGKWNGAGGITSSVAAGDVLHLHTLGIVQTGNQARIACTYYGDTNLDGIVDGTDYSVIDSSYLSESTSDFTRSVSGWGNGDFNYDGVVDGSDYTLIDNAFNRQAAQGTAELAVSTAQLGSASVVPEPSVLGIVLLAGLLGRRSRS